MAGYTLLFRHLRGKVCATALTWLPMIWVVDAANISVGSAVTALVERFKANCMYCPISRLMYSAP